MAVQKVSVNTAMAPIPPQNQQGGVQNTPAKPRKDYTKAIGWVAAGLATAGLAGVLIYNARKGRTTGGSSDPLVGVGTYVRKFLDESIFAKSAEAVKNGSQDVAVKISPDGNDWQLCNYSQNFGCHLVKKVPEGTTDVPHFEFNSGALNIKIFNENNDKARFDFILGSDRDMMLSMDVEPWRGKVKKSVAAGADCNYSFTNEQCQSILESLDLKRLVDEPNYRVMYTQSLYQMFHDIIRKEKFQKITEKTGKTFDEIKEAFNSKEFNAVLDIHQAFRHVHYRYGLPESETFKLIKGKDEFQILDDFVGGNSKLNVIDGIVDNDIHFPAEKACYEVSIPAEDGVGVLERMRLSEDGEYLLYERINPENASEKIKIKTYYPALDNTNGRITDLETNDASLYIDSAFSGLTRVEVTSPDGKAPLRFSFNSDRQWNEGIEYDDELQPYMGYIEKIAKTLSDDEGNRNFIHDFATKGKEMLEEFAK